MSEKKKVRCLCFHHLYFVPNKTDGKVIDSVAAFTHRINDKVYKRKKIWLGLIYICSGRWSFAQSKEATLSSDTMGLIATFLDYMDNGKITLGEDGLRLEGEAIDV